MYFCYLDESGSIEAPNRDRSATPVMVIAGFIVKACHVPELTLDFLNLKRKFFAPNLSNRHALSHILAEVKGSSLLRLTRSDSRDQRRLADAYRGEVLELVKAYEGRILGRVWVKRHDQGLDPTTSYCYAVQRIAAHYSRFLATKKSNGLIIADSRDPTANMTVAHSVFTQKWRAIGDPYQMMPEVPLFAHSNNHMGIQIADLLASTVIFPMAVSAYGAPSTSVHATPRYDLVRKNHGNTIKDLQYRYWDGKGRRRGGIVVSDLAGGRSGALLFRVSEGVLVAGGE